MSIIRIEDVSKFIGMDANAARSEIIECGYECRIVHSAGRTHHYLLKPDYDPLRVNIWIEKDKVSKATIG